MVQELVGDDGFNMVITKRIWSQQLSSQAEKNKKRKREKKEVVSSIPSKKMCSALQPRV